jgi:hypothetical protein
MKTGDLYAARSPSCLRLFPILLIFQNYFGKAVGPTPDLFIEAI